MFKRYLNSILRAGLFFTMLINKSFSQNTVLKHYGVNQGLPSSECYYITQDSKGYMWIATDAGVVKYDGYKFNTYNTNKGLPDNTVFAIREDKYGRIWFGSYSGKMAYYSYKTDSIFEIEANEQLSKMVKAGVANFAFDNNDTLFISNSRNGYIKVPPPHYNSTKQYLFKEDAYFVKQLNNNQYIYGNYFSFLKDKNEPLPLLYEDKKQRFYDDTSFKLHKGINHFSGCKQTDTSFLFSDYKSVFYVSSKTKKILLDSLPIKNDIVISTFCDSKKRVWVSTHSYGTFLYDTLSNHFKPVRFLENLSVSCVYEDAEQGFWLTTLENGVYYIPSLEFECVAQTAEINLDKVYSLVIKNDKISFLSAEAFFYQLDVKTKKVLQKIKTPLSATYIYNYGDNFLICSAASIIINDKTFEHLHLTIDVFNSPNGSLRLKKVIDYDQNYLVGFYDGNVVKINKKTGKGEVIIKDLPIIFSVYTMNGAIWVGTKIGVYSFQNEKLKFHGDDIPMFKKRVDAIVHDKTKLFFATRGYGVICYENGKIIHQYTESDGLASNLCKTILKDSVGNIWIGTNRGISRLKKEHNGNYSVNTINLANGLTSSEINQLTIYQNTLYFATNKGIGIVKIQDAFNSTISIPVYIENFLVNDVKSDFSKKNIYNYNQNFIKISYKGVYAKAEGDIKYKYKLEGLDTIWTYTKNTFVQFTTLPPGNYKFIVYAINFDGNISHNPAVISFVIKSPFWETWWFVTLSIGFVALIIYLLYQRRVHVIQKQESEKTEFYKQISESELKALRAQMNPHFLFNAINSIQSFVLKNDSKSAQKYLTKFARLIRSVLENSKYETIPLSKEIETLSLYIELECLRSSFSFDHEIVVRDNIHVEKMHIPPMVLQTYVENAIIHGLTPLVERKGELKLEFVFENSVLKCIIEDNGIGRKKSAEINAKKRSGHKSMGLDVTNERLDILNKNNLFKTDVVIVDKEHDGLAGGTRIEIYFEYIK